MTRKHSFRRDSSSSTRLGHFHSSIGVLACVALGLAISTWSPASSLRAQENSSAAETATAPSSKPIAQPDNAEAIVKKTAAPTQALRPRFEVHAPSVAAAARQVRESKGGWFVTQIARLYLAQADENVDGVGSGELLAVAGHVSEWPDTSVNVFVFAPDVRGRPRWAVRFDWPVAELRSRLQRLLKLPATQKLVEGLRFENEKDGGARLILGGETIGRCVALSDKRSAFASHADLPIPREPTVGVDTGQSEGIALLAAKWDLAGTEADSGATFFSSFSALTDVVYTGRIAEGGNWEERVEVHWPPLSGMGAKALFGRVKQTFFVPDAAFGALAMNTGFAPGALESMAGFGPQVIMDAPGEMEFVSEMGLGPIVSSIEPEVCVAVLPGRGFLPAPEIVVQARARQADKVVEKLRKETERINKIYVDRDRSEIWHEETVLDRPVFWSEGGGNVPGMFAPFVMRPVVFINQERDATDKERTFLVMAWTTTSPKEFVRRWRQLPRSGHHVFIPSEKKTEGQLWLNWEVLYGQIAPYVNVAMGSVIPGMMLPDASEALEQLSASRLTAELSYGGMSVVHQGPVPLGGLVLPTMAVAAAAPDDAGGSDLARERLAVQRLEVLYHHAKLFRKDLNRWPAEVVELDGYVDFAGHPELLRLDLSSRKAWRDWFGGIFDSKKDERDDDEELPEGTPKLDTKLFRIEWGKEKWKLGLTPGTLEHLERLDIDQDGVIHRVEKAAKIEDATTARAEETKTEKPAESVKNDTSTESVNKEPAVKRLLKQAGKNLARRYPQR